jgi:hypothetical protein
VKQAFRKLVVACIPDDGCLIVRGTTRRRRRRPARAARCGGVRPGATWDGRIESVDTDTGTMTFSVLRDGKPSAPSPR